MGVCNPTYINDIRDYRTINFFLTVDLLGRYQDISDFDQILKIRQETAAIKNEKKALFEAVLGEPSAHKTHKI